MERSPIPVLVGVSAVGLVVLALSPLIAVAGGGVLIVTGLVVRNRGRRATGFGLAATGATLCLVAVLLLTLVDANQDTPVIVGPETGLTPG